MTTISYQLKFRHTFHIAAGARDTTDVIFVKLEHNGIAGYGEVALPPYLKDDQFTVLSFLNSIIIPERYSTENFFSLLKQWNNLSEICYPALAALDIALHDLQGKLTGKSIRQLYNITNKEVPYTAYTIGISSVESMQEKIKEADGFRFFKLKMGGDNDAELISAFRNVTTLSYCVDANRGWKDVEQAAVFCNSLMDSGCVFAEQPFEKNWLAETALLKEKTTLPVVLDESVQTLLDIELVKDVCDGINIKLAKCGGIYAAFQMILKARENNLKVFIGCMSEGSCGCGGAAQLAPLANWVDLDGPLLINNDPFSGLNYQNGRIELSDLPGSGIILKENIFN